MIAADTSVVIAAFASWHEAHVKAREAVSGRVRLPAHVLLETFSVLTRLAPPHRAAPEVVESFLSRQFPGAPLTLPARAHWALLKHAIRVGVAGGAVYDALIAATASKASVKLLTLDRRALPTYERMGIDYELIG